MHPEYIYGKHFQQAFLDFMTEQDRHNTTEDMITREKCYNQFLFIEKYHLCWRQYDPRRPNDCHGIFPFHWLSKLDRTVRYCRYGLESHG